MDVSDIIAELAKKYSLNKNTTTQIVNSQFSFIRKIITDGELKTVILPLFGKIGVKPNRNKLLTEKREEYKRKHEQSTGEVK